MIKYWLLVTLLSTGTPNISMMSPYETLAECKQAAYNYYNYICVPVELPIKLLKDGQRK